MSLKKYISLFFHITHFSQFVLMIKVKTFFWLYTSKLYFLFYLLFYSGIYTNNSRLDKVVCAGKLGRYLAINSLTGNLHQRLLFQGENGHPSPGAC